MNNTMEILGRQIPVYGVCWILGIALSAVVAMLIIEKTTLKRYDVVYASVFSVIGGLLGSKLLFIAVSLKTIIENNVPFEAVLKGGFVFYGGLIGGMAGLLVYTKMFSMKALPIADILAVVLPLGHACGRIGCHFAGCCYGVPYEGFMSVTYTETMGNTPLNTHLFPVQLLEAVFLFVLFVVLLVLFLKTQKVGLATAVYLYSYAIMRFILEFIRGDLERGAFWGLSTSQLISIVIVVVVTIGVRIRKVEEEFSTL